MWYFAWILGVGLAVTVGILNGLWHEFHTISDDEAADPASAGSVSRQAGPTTGRHRQAWR